ncbi:hypothetical protein Lser_V15G33871 [Lactuca serriola]
MYIVYLRKCDIRSVRPKGWPAPRYDRQYLVGNTEGEANTQICSTISGRIDRRGRYCIFKGKEPPQ